MIAQWIDVKKEKGTIGVKRKNLKQGCLIIELLCLKINATGLLRLRWSVDINQLINKNLVDIVYRRL